MSYQAGWPLQQAIFARLMADAEVAALSGGRVQDGPSHGVAGVLLSLGEEVVRPWSTADGPGAMHDLAILVQSDEPGFQTAKSLAGAVCRTLDEAPLTLSRGHLVSLRFLQAQTERGKGHEGRRIVLRFRAMIEGA